MSNYIFKKLIIAFFIAFLISMAYSLIQYQSIEGLESRQGGFLIVLMNFILNILMFLSALPSFLNLNKYVRDFYALSFLSFCGGPLVILFLLLGIFLFGDSNTKKMSDFLPIALPCVIFNAVLLYSFVMFRDKIDGAK